MTNFKRDQYNRFQKETNAFNTCQKRPIHMPKETYTHAKRDLCTWRSILQHMSKETHTIHFKRDLYKTCQKRPRDLYICTSLLQHTWMREGSSTHMNGQSCRTYEWIMLHTWMSHVTDMNKSSHTYEWVMPHTNHVTHEWVMSHLWINRVLSHICINRVIDTREWVMSHI